MKVKFGLLHLLISAYLAGDCVASSAIWSPAPISGDWNTDLNWVPPSAPNGPADTASFDTTANSNVSISANTAVDGIMFTSLANAYTITVPPTLALTISGNGITNNSSETQNFDVPGDTTSTLNGTEQAQLIFTNSASAGTSVVISNYASSQTSGRVEGATIFFNSSTAAGAQINNFGAATPFAFQGSTIFHNTSNAGSATITNWGSPNLGGGVTNFFDSSSAANATIHNTDSVVANAFSQAGLLQFHGTSTAANATIVNEGGKSDDSGQSYGGYTVFYDSATAGAATIIATGVAPLAIAGNIFFLDQSSGGTARLELLGTGSLFVETSPPLIVGSIEGDGLVYLGKSQLIVGSNNVSTTFSGVIQDGGYNGGTGGSLSKTGSGALDLSGANTYTGTTNINQGLLLVDGSIASNTFVNNGELGGIGTITGNVTNHSIVFDPNGAPGTLTVNGNYTQNFQGALTVDIAGEGQNNILSVSGSASLNGLLNPVLQAGFVPSVGDQFVFLNYQSFTGSLGIENPNIDGATEHWVVTFGSNSATLTVADGNVPVPQVVITSVTRAASGVFSIYGQATPNATVVIEFAPDLNSAFTQLGSTNADQNGFFEYDDLTAGNAQQRFYEATVSQSGQDGVNPAGTNKMAGRVRATVGKTTRARHR